MNVKLTLLTAFISLLAFMSCSNEEVETQSTTPNYYTVKVNLISDTGETRATRSVTNNLYGLQVYSKSAGDANYQAYAYGLFNDPSLISVKLEEGKIYQFVCRKMELLEGMLMSTNPFMHRAKSTGNLESTELNNEMTYNTDEMIWLGNGVAELYIPNDPTNYGGYYPQVVSFYGYLSDYSPSANSTLSIDMKKVSFGMKFVAADLAEGEIRIQCNASPYQITLTPDNKEFQCVDTFKGSYSSIPNTTWMADDYSEDILISSIKWVNPSNQETVLLSNREFTFKRNMLSTITIKVYSESSATITLEQGAMTAGPTYTVQ